MPVASQQLTHGCAHVNLCQSLVCFFAEHYLPHTHLIRIVARRLLTGERTRKDPGPLLLGRTESVVVGCEPAGHVGENRVGCGRGNLPFMLGEPSRSWSGG